MFTKWQSCVTLWQVLQVIWVIRGSDFDSLFVFPCFSLIFMRILQQICYFRTFQIGKFDMITLKHDWRFQNKCDASSFQIGFIQNQALSLNWIKPCQLKPFHIYMTNLLLFMSIRSRLLSFYFWVNLIDVYLGNRQSIIIMLCELVVSQASKPIYFLKSIHKLIVVMLSSML